MHVMRDRPEAAERHGAGHVARCTARAAHGRPGPARRPPRQVPAHHAQRTARAVPGRPGQAPLRGVCSGWAVGCRHSPASGRCPLLCTYPLRVGLCGFRDRRVLPEDHRLADHLPASVHRPGPRRPENGYLAAPARGRRPDGPGAPLATVGCSTGPSATGLPLAEAEAVASVGSKGDLLSASPWPRHSTRCTRPSSSFGQGPWQDIDTARARHRRVGPLVRAPSGHTPPSACEPPPRTKPPGHPTPTATNNHNRQPPAPNKPATTKPEA